MPLRKERVKILEELEHYAGCCLEHMLHRKEQPWTAVRAWRDNRPKELGVA